MPLNDPFEQNNTYVPGKVFGDSVFSGKNSSTRQKRNYIIVAIVAVIVAIAGIIMSLL